jgi:integrase
VKGERLQRMPHIEMPRENNARRGFFEREQFESVRAHLPEYARPPATFAYLTGWRLKSEILPLQGAKSTSRAGIVRPDLGTTKNNDGRTFPMTPELRTMLEAQRAATTSLERKTNSIIPWLSHWTKKGRPRSEASSAPGCRAQPPWRWSVIERRQFIDATRSSTR